eukprot:11819347-Ditylum_brightwellii.AAC.1
MMLLIHNTDNGVDNSVKDGIKDCVEDGIDDAVLHLTHLSQGVDCHLTWRRKQNKHIVGKQTIMLMMMLKMVLTIVLKM